jgi:hypothetical protein
MINHFRKLSIAFLVLQALFLASAPAAQAEEMTCPTPLPVVIDVKPADAVNKIKLPSFGILPVAVLSTQEFDARQFMPMMAHLQDATAPMDCSGAEAVRWSYSDVNRDGRVDLVFFFRVQDLTLTASTTEVMLMAHGLYGGEEVHIMGTDQVIVKGN